MKIVIASLCLMVIICKTSAETCRSDCRNALPTSLCIRMKSYCSENEKVRRSCMLTCGECQSCAFANPKCEVGCRDYSGPIACSIMKQRKFGCVIFAGLCRATCNYCQGCLLPANEVVTCTNSTDCKDSNTNCPYWSEEGYCNPRRKFPHTRAVCPVSCGICVPCSAQEPNTALPPTSYQVAAMDRQETAMRLVEGMQKAVRNEKN